jgi:hypothetical protein
VVVNANDDATLLSVANFQEMTPELLWEQIRHWQAESDGPKR